MIPTREASVETRRRSGFRSLERIRRLTVGGAVGDSMALSRI